MSINEKWLTQLSLAFHQQYTRHWKNGLQTLVWTGGAPGSVSRARCESMLPNPLVPAFSLPGELHREPDTLVACGYRLAGASGEGETHFLLFVPFEC